MTAPDDGLKRMRAAQRFRTISFIVVAALAASALLPPQYSFAGFAIPVAVTAIVLFYFHHRTAQNTEQGIVILGALAILFAWGSTFVNAHDRGQHREIERLACQEVRGQNAEYRCEEIRDVLATPMIPASDGLD